MRALVYQGPEILRYEDVDDVFPEEFEVKIRVRATGICGSDVHGYAGLTGRRIAPMIMGHEFSGEVAALGSKVTTLQVGDRVAPYPLYFCGTCPTCLQGMTHLCLHKRAFGVLDSNGSMAEFICVPEKAAIRIKDDTDFGIAAMVEPLAVALRGVHHGGDLRGKNVLIVGAGTIGLFVLTLAKLQQPAQIIIADISEHRLDVAKKLGADVTVRSDLQDTATVVKDLTANLGADVAIECVGLSPTTQQTISSLKFGGLAVWIGNSAKMVETNMQAIVTRELMVHGSFLYALDEFREVINLLDQKIIDIRPVISREISFDEAADMFHTLYRSPGDLIKVIIRQ